MSTLTQQVAKNFLVGDERNVTRKIREVVIAGRIEKAMDKDTILELYLLTRMAEDGYAAKADAEAAKKTDIVVVDRFEGDEYLAAEYFVEEARKQKLMPLVL